MPQLAHHCVLEGRKDLRVEGDERISGNLGSQMCSSVTSQERDGGPWQAISRGELPSSHRG